MGGHSPAAQRVLRRGGQDRQGQPRRLARRPMKDGLAAVKAAIEGCYPSMGITCPEVGEYQSSGVVFSGMAKCTDPVASSDSASAPALALGAAAAAAGALLL